MNAGYETWLKFINLIPNQMDFNQIIIGYRIKHMEQQKVSRQRKFAKFCILQLDR